MRPSLRFPLADPLRSIGRWAVRTAAGLCAVAVLAPAGAAPAAPPTVHDGGTLVVGSTQSPRNLNGAVQSGAATALPSTQLFASPLRFDDKWNPQPYLAESWKLADDGKSLTLHLRHNAFFHDGTPITSEDVAFSIMAIKANHPFQTMMGPVEKVDTPDPYTAIIRMSVPHPAIVLAMSPALCPIMPKHIYGDGQDLKSHPRNSVGVVGSGPFKLVEFKPGQRIVMEKFDKFFLPGRPHLDKLIVDINPDLQSLSLGLERGDVQMIGFISTPTDLQRLAKEPQIDLTSKGYDGIGSLNWLAFNLERKPMSDLAFRKAVATAIDKNFILKALMGGYSFPADGPIARGSPFHVDDVVKYPFDLKKANDMLDAAGYKRDADGVRVRLTIDYYPGADSQQKNIAEYMRTALKKVGIELTVRAPADFASWAKRMASHDFDLSMDAAFNWGDPIIGVHRTYLSTNIRPIVWTNTQSYRNPKVDELLNAAGSILDPTQRKAYYSAFAKIVTDELPVYVLDQVGYYTASSKRVGNVPVSIWGTLSPFDDVYLK
jgi:peptide/nickel transport system substrate-binding protein